MVLNRANLGNGAIKKITEKIERIAPILEGVYGHPTYHPHAQEDPLDELIRTILSQNTTDANTHLAWSRLKRRWPTWEGLWVEGDAVTLQDAIKPGGLSAIKAERIINILGELMEREGKLSLDILGEMDDEGAIAYLISFKGVGLKTAYCVLAFSLGRDLLPVDTHILRLSRRLGFLPERTTMDEAHIILNRATPSGMALSFHMNLIAHGREVCSARNPHCMRCPLPVECLYYSGEVVV